MLSEEYIWLDELKGNGYRYIIMPTRKTKTFYATKAEMKKNGEFRSNASFDEFNLSVKEKWLPALDRGVFINLQA